VIDPQIGPRINGLQAAYIAALDAKDMRAWLATFAESEQASYTCISAENVSSGLPVALMLDDNRGRLQDRVTFVDKVWAGTFQDYRTRHFVQPLTCEAIRSGVYHARTNFFVACTTDESSDVLATGVYEDEVLIDGSIARFISKRAVIDTSVLPRYIVYPL